MLFLMFFRNFLCNNLRLQRNHQNQLVTDYFQFSQIYTFHFFNSESYWHTPVASSALNYNDMNLIHCKFIMHRKDWKYHLKIVLQSNLWPYNLCLWWYLWMMTKCCVGKYSVWYDMSFQWCTLLSRLARVRLFSINEFIKHVSYEGSTCMSVRPVRTTLNYV